MKKIIVLFGLLCLGITAQARTGLVGGSLIQDPLTPADGTQNVTGAIVASGNIKSDSGYFISANNDVHLEATAPGKKIVVRSPSDGFNQIFGGYTQVEGFLLGFPSGGDPDTDQAWQLDYDGTSGRLLLTDIFGTGVLSAYGTPSQATLSGPAILDLFFPTVKISNRFLFASDSGFTISSGAFTSLTNRSTLTADGGVSDQLDTVNGLMDGEVLWLRGAAGNTITVSEAGNIKVPGASIVLSETLYTPFMYDVVLGKLLCLVGAAIVD